MQVFDGPWLCLVCLCSCAAEQVHCQSCASCQGLGAVLHAPCCLKLHTFRSGTPKASQMSMSRHGHDFLHYIKTLLQEELQEVRGTSAKVQRQEREWGSKAIQYLQDVTGDIAGAASLRMAQPIGLLMLAIRESEELCDDIYESWVHDSQVDLEAQQTDPHCTSQSDDRPTDS